MLRFMDSPRIIKLPPFDLYGLDRIYGFQFGDETLNFLPFFLPSLLLQGNRPQIVRKTKGQAISLLGCIYIYIYPYCGGC